MRAYVFLINELNSILKGWTERECFCWLIPIFKILLVASLNQEDLDNFGFPPQIVERFWEES